MPETQQLITDLKAHIFETLEIEDVQPDSIGPDDPLFGESPVLDGHLVLGEGLGLDSIDAVELVVMVERHYGIKMRKMAETRAAFVSIRTLADFIEDHRKSA